MSNRKSRKRPADSLTVVRQLARQAGTRTKSINLFDRNVCTGERVAARPWELNVVSGEMFCLQLLYRCGERKTEIFANRQFISASAIGSFNLGFVLSINKPNAINPMPSAGNHMFGERCYPLFAKSGHLTPAQELLLAHPALSAVIKSGNLNPDESLHFFDDQITVYFDKPSLERLQETINEMTALAAAIQVPEEEIDLSSLPALFHPLIPLIRKWGIADDHERECFLSEHPLAVRRRLVQTVTPYLHSIDSYLDSFGERQPSEEAAALGRLAECAAEAKLPAAACGELKR